MASTYNLADGVLGGRLAETLSEWRSEDPRPSFDLIVVRLKEHGIVVSRETVRQWVNRQLAQSAA